MGFWSEVFVFVASTISEERKKSKNDAKVAARSVELDRMYSLTCRKCNGLARPIADTRNRYRCGCGNQFAAARHDLVSVE